MKKWRFILLLCLALITISCRIKEETCVPNIVVPSELKDYVPYETGEQLVYQSVAGQLDTFAISEIRLDTFPGSRFDCPYIFERVYCKIQAILSDSSSMKTNHLITLFDYVVSPSTMLIEVDGGVFQATDFGSSTNAEIILLDSLNVQGTRYNDILLASCGNPVGCSFIDSMVLVKNQGLVYYTIYGVGRVKI